MKGALAALVALYLLVCVVPLGPLPLFSPDHTRYAEIPREMLATGDWVVPRLNGALYFEKPPLFYWVAASLMAVLGESRFVLRLPGVIAVALTAAMAGVLATRLSGQRRTGVLAAGVYASSLLVFIIGTFNLPDNLLTLFFAGSLAAFLLASEEERGTRRTLLLVLAGACCGLAFLTKGFLAVVLPMMVGGAFLLVERRWRDALRLAWMPLLAALAVAAPWAILIQMREPDFWRYFVWVEHLRRFFEPVGASQHPQSVAFFVPILLLGMIPWLPLVPAAVVGLRSVGLANRVARFCLLWLGLVFVFFTASSGKLATYILPAFPPLAVLLAAGIARYLDDGRQALLRAGAGLSALGGLAGLLVVAFPMSDAFAADETWKWSLVLISLVWWVAASGAAALTTRASARLWAHGLAPLCLMVVAHLAVPVSTLDRAAFGPFLEANAWRVDPDAILVSDRHTFHAVCWHLRRSDVYLYPTPGELAYGLSRPDAAHRLLGSRADLRHLIQRLGPSREVVLILTRPAAEKAEGVFGKPGLPRPVFRTEGLGLVWIQFGGKEDARRDGTSPAASPP